ncbi:Nek1, partial [Symbiodinium sp. KB8]
MELCIVQEFADGGDLAMQVEQLSKARRYMAEELIWTYAIQALEGLTHLHSLGILHRDLKPANIMLCLDGTIKLGDLNVSKLAKFSLVKTQIGTPYYMSPEIWNNKPYGDRSDMWALGCVIYELAALKPPFQGRNIDELSRKVQAGYFPRVPAHYSKDLEELISSLLRKNARQRPSASALLKSGLITKKRAELRRWMDETRRVRDAGTTGPVISKLELRPLSRGRCLRPAAEALLLATCPGASNLCAAAAATAAAAEDFHESANSNLLGTIAVPARMDARSVAQIQLPSPQYHRPAANSRKSFGGSHGASSDKSAEPAVAAAAA